MISKAFRDANVMPVENVSFLTTKKQIEDIFNKNDA